MKKVVDHIEDIKGKPHHIRKQIAFAAAFGGATLIGLVWLVGSLTLGTFAIGEHSFADSSEGSTVAAVSNTTGSNSLAGAASAIEDSSAPAHIEIVNAPPKNPPKKAEQTTIPF